MKFRALPRFFRILLIIIFILILPTFVLIWIFDQLQLIKSGFGYLLGFSLAWISIEIYRATDEKLSKQKSILRFPRRDRFVIISSALLSLLGWLLLIYQDFRPAWIILAFIPAILAIYALPICLFGSEDLRRDKQYGFSIFYKFLRKEQAREKNSQDQEMQAH